MRAVVFEEFGEPVDVLRIVDDKPIPEPGRGEVRVRMLASPINPSDLMTVRGIYSKRPELPATPGFEGIGFVDAVGGGLLAKFMAGKRVAVLNGQTGNWSDYTIIPAKQAVPLADAVPWEQGAMFFVNPTTAYAMTREVLNVPKGNWLLQTAAASQLGRMVIRLGRLYGFKTMCVVRRQEQSEDLFKLGADAVLTFDPEKDTRSDLRNTVLEKTSNAGVRYAIDCVGGQTGSAVVNCLGEDGRLLVYGTLSAEPLGFSSRELMTPGASVEGFWLARWMQQQSLLKKLGVVKQVNKLLQSEVLSSEVGKTFPLNQVKKAVQHAEAQDRGGKVLLRMAE